MRHATRSCAVLLAGGLIVAAAMSACGGSIAPNPLTPTQATITALPSIADMLAEKIIGNAGAPNTIIEYVSFVQPASATFHLQVVPQLKSQYADTGRAQILFRNLFFPNESGVPAELVRCAGNARFFDAVNLLFTNQATWANASNADTAAESYMLGFGMSQAVVNACVGNASLDAGLVTIANGAVGATYLLPDGTQRAPGSLGGGSTGTIAALPAIVVNGVLFDGKNNDMSDNAAFAPTLANMKPFINK